MLNATTLPETTEELSGLLIALDAKYRAQIEFLEERVRFLQKELLGRKSEKRPQESAARQLELLNEAEVLAEMPTTTETLVVPLHSRRKPKHKPLPGNLPRVEVIHDLDEGEKVCACGANLSRIGEEQGVKSALD